MASPTARRERGLLIIEIPEENIISGVENTPRDAVKVTDREAFLNAVAEKILDFENGNYDAPAFFEPFEQLANEMVESGEEFVEPT